MSVPPVLRPKNEREVLTSRASAPPLVALQSRYPSLLPWVIAVAALIVGCAIGVLVMRHRHEGQKVVAAVNGVKITQDQLFSRLQQAGGAPVVHKMVEEELQLQFAAKEKLSPTDGQVESRYETIRKDPRFMPALLASGMSLDDYKRSLRVKLAQANVLTQGVSVSDAEVRKFYAAQSDPRNPQAQFYKPETATFSVIATGNLEHPEVAKRAADAALSELKANTPFGIVANEYSIDPSKSSGGQLAPLQRGRSPLSQNPALENTLFSLKAGQLYGPVNFNKGWWIFRCEDKAPGQAMPFESIKDEVELGAKIVKGTTVNGPKVQRDFQEFMRTSTLQPFWPQYQHAVTGR